MGRVNIGKQVKVDGKWTSRSISKKTSGHYDWAAVGATRLEQPITWLALAGELQRDWARTERH